eukprot:scaffold42200_cov60-Phaeocystis_antarctica.AAC.2
MPASVLCAAAARAALPRGARLPVAQREDERRVPRSLGGKPSDEHCDAGKSRSAPYAFADFFCCRFVSKFNGDKGPLSRLHPLGRACAS